MTYGVGFRLRGGAERVLAAAMNEQAVKAILITAVGGALASLLYHFVIYPWALKNLNNLG